MYGVWGKRWHADSYVFGWFVWGGVLDPFPGMSDDCLAGPDFKLATLVAHSKAPLQDDGVFLELRRLSGLLPAGGAAHVRDAEAAFAGVEPPDIFIDEFGHIARGLDARRCFNEFGQAIAPLSPV